MGVGARCTYAPGDMFRAVPPADAYRVKRILHDWNDEECRQMLSAMHRAAPQHGRVLIIEQVVPGPDTPHLSKLMDIHMLITATGQERTLEEDVGLLEGAGWTYRQTWYPASKRLGRAWRCWGYTTQEAALIHCDTRLLGRVGGWERCQAMLAAPCYDRQKRSPPQVLHALAAYPGGRLVLGGHPQVILSRVRKQSPQVDQTLAAAYRDTPQRSVVFSSPG